MIQNNVKKFKPILELSLAQQNIFDLLNNFLRNQLIKAASVTDFSSTTVKNHIFKEILAQNWTRTIVFFIIIAVNLYHF